MLPVYYVFNQKYFVENQNENFKSFTALSRYLDSSKSNV